MFSAASADPSRVRSVRRLANPDPEKNDEPTLRAVAHWWCALDLDSLARPASILASDLVASAKFAIGHLPHAFHDVRCIVQATAGHGIKPGSRLRLWYWLADLPQAMSWVSGSRIGQSILAHSAPRSRFTQPLPSSSVGRTICLANCGRSRSADRNRPSPDTLRPPERRPIAATPRGHNSVSRSDIDDFIDATLARVRAAPDYSKHYTLRNSARLLGGVQAQAGLADSEALRWLMDALPQSAKDLRTAEKTARWGLDVGRLAPLKLNGRMRQAPDPRRRGDPLAQPSGCCASACQAWLCWPNCMNGTTAGRTRCQRAKLRKSHVGRRRDA